jgi:hypothetical protein
MLPHARPTLDLLDAQGPTHFLNGDRRFRCNQRGSDAPGIVTALAGRGPRPHPTSITSFDLPKGDAGRPATRLGGGMRLRARSSRKPRTERFPTAIRTSPLHPFRRLADCAVGEPAQGQTARESIVFRRGATIVRIQYPRGFDVLQYVSVAARPQRNASALTR